MVIRPTHVSDKGRWLRVTNGLARAEWWGARANDNTNDNEPVQACLEKLGRVDFMAKTYLIEARVGAGTPWSISVATGNRIIGAGIDKTILQFRRPEGIDTKAISAIGTPPNWITDNAVISDLTIDCGFAQSDSKTTHKAIDIKGANCLVERVKAVNFSPGKPDSEPGLECFVIASTLKSHSPPQDGDTLMGTIRDCEVTEPAANSEIDFGNPMPEITCLSIVGETGHPLGYTGRIVGNKIFNMRPPSGATQTPLQGITVGHCRLSEIAENEIVNLDGAGIVWMSHKDEEVVIRANRMVNVTGGVVILVQDVNQNPEHLKTKIFDNQIVLGQYVSVAQSFQLAGVYLHIKGGISPSPTPVRLGDLWIQRNYIYGKNIGEKTAFGIMCFFNSAVYNNINIEDNILEVPDPGGTPSLNAPYENALWFAEREYGLYDSAKPKVHNNRSLAGKDLRLKLVSLTSPYSARWGRYSERVARFKAIVHDAQIGALYEEFVGEAPRFGLAGRRWRPTAGMSPRWTARTDASGSGSFSPARAPSGARPSDWGA
ncbi:MAG: hypothetical protein FJ387_07385 [Verrucomicrobia bacterium]|nr:hypothetical protein [Verrucomicrobiota bacterium]